MNGRKNREIELQMEWRSMERRRKTMDREQEGNAKEMKEKENKWKANGEDAEMNGSTCEGN